MNDLEKQRIKRSMELLGRATPRPITELIPYERNQKNHDARQVANIATSLRRFGWRQPVVVDARNVIVIGHGRVLAAQQLGLDTVPVIDAADLTEDEIRELRIVDNKTNEAPWNDFLAEDLQELTFEGFDFADMETAAPGGGDPEEAPEVTEDTPPEPPEEPRTRPGDLYQLGRHRLLCGDATNEADMDVLMGGIIADIAITSPPYGMSGSTEVRDHYVKGRAKRKTLYENHADRKQEWPGLMRASMLQMKRVTGAQFINIQMLGENKHALIDFIHEWNTNLVDLIIWDKEKAPPQMHENVLNNLFEFVLIFGGDNASRMIPFSEFHADKYNMFRFKIEPNEYADIHRAVYPVKLPAACMNVANKAHTVLDPFGGTGTTMIAAEQLGRVCYMMELDPLYCDVIVQRWETFTGQKAVLLTPHE